MAVRLLQRVNGVFDLAIALEMRTSANPCTGVKKLLGPQNARVTPRRALPHDEAPQMFHRLSNLDTPQAACLALIMLTAVRSEEARGGRWTEVDWEAGFWTIPTERMKKRRPHTVILSRQAVTLLLKVKAMGWHQDRMFPGARPAAPISGTSLRDLTKQLGVSGDTDVHGLRSTFATWAEEQGKWDSKVRELCLAHLHGSAVERAYHRSQRVDEREELMQAWADFICPPSADGEG